LLWGSGSGENISKVSARLIWEQNLRLIASDISSLVIDELCDGPCNEDITTAMFYCDFCDQQEQTTTNILGAILTQLTVREGVMEDVRKAFQKAKNEVGGRSLRLPDMEQMLRHAVAKLPHVFICIDALDECLPKHLLDLLTSLKYILAESPRARIFATGRRHVQGEIASFFPIGLVVVPISPKTEDIEKYLEKKLEMDTEREAMSGSLRADILRIIPQKISGMYVEESLVPDPCMILF